MKRKHPIVTGNVYHVLNKSIAGYVIFTSHKEFVRMIQMLRFFSIDNNLPKFSRFIEQNSEKGKSIEQILSEKAEEGTLIDIIAYCIMPTHFHLVIRQNKDNGVSKFIGNLCNSYARYFNTKYERKGRLWEGVFKNVSVDSEEQLLHLTRYIHLNPATAGLVKKAEGWKYSSYDEYLGLSRTIFPFCKFSNLIDMSSKEYRSFVENQAEYQKELATLKKITLEKLN